MTSEPATTTKPADTRLLAALAYVPGLCILTMLLDDGASFSRHHARQGLVLFFLEIVAAIALAILDATFGRVPLVGGLFVGVLKLLTGLGLLALAATGAAKAAMGDAYRLPFIARYADRLAL